MIRTELWYYGTIVRIDEHKMIGGLGKCIARAYVLSSPDQNDDRTLQ